MIGTSSSAAISFQVVVEDCIAAKISKEQALKLLESKYKSARINIKETLGQDHISFCCYVPCKFDKYIEICDGAERNKPMSERQKYENRIQKVIEKVTAQYRETLELEKAESEAIVDVYKEVHQIQNFCRENRELDKWYKKYKGEIEALPDTPLQIETGMKEQMQSLDIPPAIQSLIDGGLLEKECDKDGRHQIVQGKKDGHIIAWIFDYSGYEDYITPKTYCKYISTRCQQSTIERYFSKIKTKKEKSV